MEGIFYQAYVSLRNDINSSNSEVTHDPLPEVPGDPVELRQLLQELIANAIKYRATRAARIHVTCWTEQQRHVFAVRDNGIGIPSDEQQRIFDLFVRLDDRPHCPGTGIGLAFCKRIVQQYGGKIWVESEEGNGSTFYFTLPIKGQEKGSSSSSPSANGL